MLSKLGNYLGNFSNYLNKKGLSLQKECTCELPTVEGEEEPIYMRQGRLEPSYPKKSRNNHYQILLVYKN